MATGTCEFCGREEYMPFACKFCKARFCAEHRLPENHACRGLDLYRDRVRETGRIVMPEGQVASPSVSAGARMGAGMGQIFARVEGRMAYVFLGAMVAVYVLVTILDLAEQEGAIAALFVLDRFVYLRPWTLVTSIFTHLSIGHLFFNALAFFFFAPSLEKLIGTRRFTYLFVGGGVIAGALQLAVFTYWLPTTGIFSPELSSQLANAGIIGASGGLMALFGAMTYLAPRLTILVMFILPAPLWLLTTLLVLIDLTGLAYPAGGVANLAHLAGLAIGLAYGKRLHDQGLRVRVPTPAPPPFRRF